MMPGNTEPTAKPAWIIVRIEDNTSFTPGTGPVRIKRVYFALYDGTQSYVDIPFDKFTQQEVNKQVDMHASQLAEVAALTGPIVTV